MRKRINKPKKEHLGIPDNNHCMQVTDDSDESEEHEDVNIPVNESLIEDNLERRPISKVLIVAFIVFVAVLIANYNYESEFPSLNTTFKGFDEKLNQMKSDFPSQSKSSWKMLNNSLTRQINRDRLPKKPSVLIFVGRQNRIELFKQHVVNLIAGSNLGSDCPTYEMKNVFQEADDLMDDMYGFLADKRKAGFHCAFWPYIDRIPPTLGIPLHGLTDELNAKYKDELYIFSFYVNSSGSSLPYRNDQEAEDILLDRLRSVWESGMGVERFAALTTRLCVNVMAVM